MKKEEYKEKYEISENSIEWKSKKGKRKVAKNTLGCH